MITLCSDGLRLALETLGSLGWNWEELLKYFKKVVSAPSVTREQDLISVYFYLPAVREVHEALGGRCKDLPRGLRLRFSW